MLMRPDWLAFVIQTDWNFRLALTGLQLVGRNQKVLTKSRTASSQSVEMSGMSVGGGRSSLGTQPTMLTLRITQWLGFMSSSRAGAWSAQVSDRAGPVSSRTTSIRSRVPATNVTRALRGCISPMWLSLTTEDLPGTADLAWVSFPCQDLSLAGSGGGLRGERSGAFWPFWRAVEELAAAGRGPSTVVLENVCGTLTSHKGEDFVAIGGAIESVGYRF